MSNGGFKLTRDSFVKENKGNVFETVQQENMQKAEKNRPKFPVLWKLTMKN